MAYRPKQEDNVNFWPRHLAVRSWFGQHAFFMYICLFFMIISLLASLWVAIHTYSIYKNSRDVYIALVNDPESKILEKHMKQYDKTVATIMKKSNAIQNYQNNRRLIFHVMDIVNTLRTVEGQEVYLEKIVCAANGITIQGVANDTKTGGLITQRLQHHLQGVTMHEQQTAKTDGTGFTFTIQGRREGQPLADEGSPKST